MSHDFLIQAIVYLTAAILCVPIAKKIGMGSVLGYLTAGILIGPFVLGFVGQEGKDVMHIAEFGVVMMLFLIGLELEPEKFWKLRKVIVGMGLSQVVITSLILFLLGLLAGFTWRVSVAISLSLAMSSTAIVLQSLKEKGMMNTSAGQGAFSILLFQDISVIPILAIIPLLAVSQVTQDSSHNSHSLLENAPAWLQTLMVLGAVGLVALSGRFLIVPLLHQVAKTRLRELFTASSLLIVVAIAYLMGLVGLSPALGTFLAGVVLANSEFRHELESDLEPFKGLLLGLFFIGVGASIDFHIISENPFRILIYVLVILLIKTVVLFGIGKIFQMSLDQNLFYSLALSQVGEFAFVLFSFIGQLGILDAASNGIMMAVTAITMTLTPMILLTYEKLIQPKLVKNKEEEKEADSIEENNSVILVGFAHFGSTIGRFLRANGVNATILDNDSDRVELLRKMGFKVYFGDATRLDLLESAGAEHAKIFVSAISSPETNYAIGEMLKKHFPNLSFFVRAQDRFAAYELIDMGFTKVYRENLDTAIRVGIDILKEIGFRSYTATRSGQNFLKYDEDALIGLAKDRHDSKKYISSVREQIEQIEKLLSTDISQKANLADHAWDSDPLRTAANEMKPLNQ
ncbi:MAG TPA: monovalent cation:proton antiporter-2 (CPA2) family protein [Leptospiraceae bacterium]|nr:monovalent cation:proton antiporter-2 (CPA2) family protein [Leptospiraceae bacterium]HMX30835.1 monovalent cation:proton antiporter-2 (CPA2) family protein [Leptospiraceae bacterium]HMY30091.1 monovalent cation:proton antiporter-2 (CPA2) family protein [Leptospiraceae bacterium]HMZ62722.1 monovalent cation:proton antiporter-2 (CPA2) family protein [Leptospiraceae bacterium]HNA07248.1 monovalent cation:proton antiporter-2 (CPA2) family protein [Leptospiraceae bacterium]